MNEKRAKALRKMVNYKPKDERKYTHLTLFGWLGHVRQVKTTKINTEESSRGQYLKAKREYGGG